MHFGPRLDTQERNFWKSGGKDFEVAPPNPVDKGLAEARPSGARALRYEERDWEYGDLDWNRAESPVNGLRRRGKIKRTGPLTLEFAPTYLLILNSTNPASGVAIGVALADNNKTTSETTSSTLTCNAGTSVTLTAPATSSSNTFNSWTGCTAASTVTFTVALNANATARPPMPDLQSP